MATKATPTRGGYLLTPAPVKSALALNVKATDKSVVWHVPANTPTGNASAYAPHVDKGVHHQRAYIRAVIAKRDHIATRDGITHTQANDLAVALVNSQRRGNARRWAGCRDYNTGMVI